MNNYDIRAERVSKRPLNMLFRGRSLTVAALIFVLIFQTFNVFAAPQPPETNLGKPWFTKVGMFSPQIYIDLYMTSTCPNCLRANEFFKALEQQQAWVVVHRHWIDKDITALKEFTRELKLFNYEGGYAVPSIFFCKTHWIGFNDIKLSGEMLLKGLNACFTSIYFNGEISSQVLSQLQRLSEESQALSHIDHTAKITWSTLVVQSAFLDAMTPCAFFVIMAFLALLGLTGESRLTKAMVGVLFLFTIGLIHFFQLLHWDKYSVWLFNLIPVARICGGVLLARLIYILYKKNSHKPYLLSVVTAWAVYSYQQQCAFAFPEFYQFWMASHSKTIIFLSTIFYQFLYLGILSVILGLITGLGIPKPKLFSKMSWLTLFAVSVVLLWNPSALSSIWLSSLVLLIAVIVGIIWHNFAARVRGRA